MLRAFVIAYSSEWAACVDRLFGRRSDIEIVKLAFAGEHVLAQLAAHRPEVVVVEGGTDWSALQLLTRSIMQIQPSPVVVLVTQTDAVEGVKESADALEAGALGILTLPSCGSVTPREEEARHLVKSLQLLSEVKVVRRWDRQRMDSLARVQQEMASVVRHEHRIGIVVIGASAGGTKALQQVFSGLPGDFPLPILVVQHIASGYLGGLVRWLGEQTELSVRIAEEGLPLESGTVYLAPDSLHLTVDQKHCILLTDDDPVNGFKPSIARLFGSVVDTYGGNAAAVLLSGMGNDGALEMRRLHDAGAITIAQDKDTSLIHGIPGEAIKLEAVTSVLPVQEIGPALDTIAHRPCQGMRLPPSWDQHNDIAQQE
ncbi:MAG: chemotaxis response regulator protein-glutamate methylesterase [Bacteroidetes bacterium]|nr:chemotaxis response regulator protein-glutamate methylesterase [Bacteroidota bacterium]